MSTHQKKVAVFPSLANLPRLMKIEEVAHILAVSVRTVHRILKLKQLTCTRVRGQLRFDPAHIVEYLSKRTVKAAA